MSDISALPLRGRCILVTRAADQAQSWIEQIESRGGEALCFPLLVIRPPSDASLLAELDAAIDQLYTYRWLIFTSVNGVRFFYERLILRRGTSDLPAALNVAAVGPETAKALAERGIQALIPDTAYQQEGLVLSLQPYVRAGDRVLLPTAAVTRDHLSRTLRESGAIVHQVTVYETGNGQGFSGEARIGKSDQSGQCDYSDREGRGERSGESGHSGQGGRSDLRGRGERLKPRGGPGRFVSGDDVVSMLLSGDIDCIPLTSSSAVTHLLSFLAERGAADPAQWLRRTHIVCIGEITARTAESAGLHVSGVAEKATVSSLTETMIRCLTDHTDRKGNSEKGDD